MYILNRKYLIFYSLLNKYEYDLKMYEHDKLANFLIAIGDI